MDTRPDERHPGATLAPPPRAVPFLLRCRLLANGATVWGSVVFGLACILAVALVAGMDPLGSLRLAWNRQEAPGQVVEERDTSYEENDSRIRRHDYTFRLPDGTELRGHSYSDGHQYLNVPTVPGDRDPTRWARVTIEYDPGHPEANRIKGTRTHAVAHWAAFVLIFPAGALLVALAGVASGWSRIRLLRGGRLAWATLTAGKLRTGAETEEDFPIAECRHRLAEQARQAERSARSPFVLVWNGLHSVWSLAVGVMIAGGVIFIVFAIVKVGLGDESFWINGRQARGAEGVLWLGGFLIVWLFVGGVMLAGGQLMRLTPKNLSPKVDWAFEFRLPDGQVVRARETLPAAVADSDAPLPVLYNPKCPQDQVLLAALSPPVPVSPEGGWQTASSLWPLVRLAVALLAFVGGPLVGVILAVD
jgi:hypothetical protein